MKPAGQPRGFEGGGDFFHLADVAPRFGCCHCGSAKATCLELLLRNAPFLKQSLVDSFMRGQRANCEQENIRALRFTYHADVIIDDVQYYFENPYQDDIIAADVEDVVADGATYYSSASNSGNLDDGTSGT